MKPKRSTPPSGGIDISGNLHGVAIANGANARAHTSMTPAGPAADLGAVEVELAALRTQLARLRAAGSVGADALDAAEALEREVRQPDPDTDEVTRRLGRLSMVLGGVTAVAETLTRLSQAVGRLVGLG